MALTADMKRIFHMERIIAKSDLFATVQLATVHLGEHKITVVTRWNIRTKFWPYPSL